MKPRHAAALVLVGWYLMMPPRCTEMTPGAGDVEAGPLALCRWTGQPMRYWELRESFDTAKDCRAYIRDWQARARSSERKELGSKIYGKWSETWWKSLSETQQAVVMDSDDADVARCIASDDPRLKEK